MRHLTSTIDRFACAGSSITSASISGDSAYVTLSGTSMATPAVAGVMALIREAKPQFSPTNVKEALYAGAVTINRLNTEGNDYFLQVNSCMFA